MEEEIKRDYLGADYYLLEHSQLLKDLLEDDLADFTAFDLEYTAAFVLAWQDAINAAVNYTDDATVTAQIEAQSQTVDTAMQACKDKYTDIIYFAEKAFGKRNVVLKEFGQGVAYRKAGKTHERMFEFMDELNQTATKYASQLEAKGCPPASITTIPTVRDTLNTSNREQNLAVKGRPVISQGRVIVYNALYSITRQTIDAAQRVYRTNPAKRAQYDYNPPVNENDIIVRQVTLSAGQIGNIDITDMIGQEPEPNQVDFEASGSNGQYYASDTTNGLPGAGPVYPVLDGQKLEKTDEQVATELGISPAQPFLNVQNTGSTSGVFKVTFHFE